MLLFSILLIVLTLTAFLEGFFKTNENPTLTLEESLIRHIIYSDFQPLDINTSMLLDISSLVRACKSIKEPILGNIFKISITLLESYCASDDVLCEEKSM